jgi:hypothetical protein
MLQHQWLDGCLVALMAVGLVGTLYHRIRLELGLGDRAIQLVGICLVIPTVLILGLEDKVSRETMGTVLGAIIGYVLSGISSRDAKPKKKAQEKEFVMPDFPPFPPTPTPTGGPPDNDNAGSFEEPGGGPAPHGGGGGH